MNSPTPHTAPDGAAKHLSQAAVYAERANLLMRSHGVIPSPRNYSIFFSYAAGQPTELMREIESIIAKKAAFTEEVLDKIHIAYIAEAQTRAVQDSAANAKRILTEMMQSVSNFAGSTSAVSQDVQRQLQQMDEAASEEVVRMLANTLVESAITMQNSSETMTVRLAGAQQEIMELRESLARVVTEAERDFLTGSLNRKAFDKRLDEAISEAKSKDSDLTLLMIDIDHFKGFNDNYGHLIGDEVLKIVAKALTDTLKGTDTVARYGGEEFSVILPRTPLSGGMIVAEEIRKSIASKELKRKSTGENFGVITVSIGVACLRHNDDSIASFIGRADKALYRSKHTGRNRVTSEAMAVND